MHGIAQHLSTTEMIKLSSSPDSHREMRNANTTEVELFEQLPETAAAVARPRRPELPSEKALGRKALPGAFQSDTPPAARRRSALDPSHPRETCCAQDLDAYLIFQARISSLSSDGTACVGAGYWKGIMDGERPTRAPKKYI